YFFELLSLFGYFLKETASLAHGFKESSEASTRHSSSTLLKYLVGTQTNPKKEPRFQGEKIMEGVGSRMGRTSSRYGLSATATVFNGSVRKWKRKWVHVSPSPTLNYRNNNHSNGHNDQNNNGSRLLLCRWTPLFPAASTSTTTEDPPKRKFRYTPIAVLKERSKAEKKAEQEVEKQLVAWQTAKNDEQNDEDDFKSETQVSPTY
ncbi:hypothetical protein NC652_027897, partial [Populus alba x Populus x berolinensis]